MWSNCALFLVVIIFQCCALGNAGGETPLSGLRCKFEQHDGLYFYGPIIKILRNIPDVHQCVAQCQQFVLNGVRRCQAVNYLKRHKRCEIMHKKFDAYNQLLIKYYGDRNPNAVYSSVASSASETRFNCEQSSDTGAGVPTSSSGSGGEATVAKTTVGATTISPTTVGSGGASPKPTCGQTSIDPMGTGAFKRIVGGDQAIKHSIPWIVSIRFGYNDPRLHACGGTLIRVSDANETDILITAAHCVKDEFEPNDRYVQIVAGGHDLLKPSEGEQESGYTEVVFHEKYNAATKENDIAVVKLSKPFKFGPNIQPACLPKAKEKVPDGKKGLVAGWGLLEEGGKRAIQLHQLVVPVVNSQKCQEYYKDVDNPKFSDEEIMLCAGYPEGGKDSCQGDSGGPLLFKDDKGSYVLQGMVSFGKGCARPGKAGVYTRVSSYIDWINQNVQKMSTLVNKPKAK